MVFNQLIVPLLIFSLSSSLTCLTLNQLVLSGEIPCWSLMRAKGLTQLIDKFRSCDTILQRSLMCSVCILLTYYLCPLLFKKPLKSCQFVVYVFKNPTLFLKFKTFLGIPAPLISRYLPSLSQIMRVLINHTQKSPYLIAILFKILLLFPKS